MKKNILMDHLVARLDRFVERQGDMASKLRTALSAIRMQAYLNTYVAGETYYLGNDRVRVSSLGNKVREYLIAKGFVFTGEPEMCWFYGYLPSSREGDDVPVVTFEIHNHGIDLSVYISGDEEKVKELSAWSEDLFEVDGTPITNITWDQDANIKLVKNTTRLDNVKPWNPKLYPWFAGDVKSYFELFMESEENVLIIYGPPGGGKSSFVRSGLDAIKKRAWLTYSVEAMQKEILVSQFMKNSKAAFMVYEDCDIIMSPREDGNTLMSSFLNVTQGIVQRDNKKFVFLTNLTSLKHIDEALLRNGRCFDILHFRHLTPVEGAEARLSLDLPSIDFGSIEKVSLADATRVQLSINRTENRHAARLGFN